MIFYFLCIEIYFLTNNPKNAMKNTIKLPKITTFLLLFTLSFITFNCSKSVTTPITPASPIEGNWKFTSYSTKDGTAAEADQTSTLILFVPCIKDLIITFDNKGVITGGAKCDISASGFTADGKSTYVVAGSKLTITNSTTAQKNDFDLAFSGSTMSWSLTTTANGKTSVVKFVFTKA